MCAHHDATICQAPLCLAAGPGAVVLACPPSLRPATGPRPKARIRLVASGARMPTARSTARSRSPCRAGWKTYWRNPGHRRDRADDSISPPRTISASAEVSSRCPGWSTTATASPMSISAVSCCRSALRCPTRKCRSSWPSPCASACARRSASRTRSPPIWSCRRARTMRRPRRFWRRRAPVCRGRPSPASSPSTALRAGRD